MTTHVAPIGAKESEVAHTSTLTSNIHSLFISFYRPTQKRWKIVIEKGAFPSDWVGYPFTPPRPLVVLKPRSNEFRGDAIFPVCRPLPPATP